MAATPKRKRRAIKKKPKDWKDSLTISDGRRRLLDDPKFMKEFIYHSASTLPINQTCALMMVSEKTYHDWMQKGQEFLDGEEPEYHRIYGHFYQQIQRARAIWQRNLLAKAEKDKGGNWRRELQILERRDPNNWAPQQRSSAPDVTNFDPISNQQALLLRRNSYGGKTRLF